MVITDEIIGVSQLLGEACARAAPPKSTPVFMESNPWHFKFKVAVSATLINNNIFEG